MRADDMVPRKLGSFILSKSMPTFEPSEESGIASGFAGLTTEPAADESANAVLLKSIQMSLLFCEKNRSARLRAAHGPTLIGSTRSSPGRLRNSMHKVLTD